MAYRILMVEDHPLFRDGVRHVLESQPDFVLAGEAATLRDAELLADRNEFDVALVDLSLPDGSGLDLVRRICSTGSSAAVLVMSVHASAEFVRASFRYGARGYITKGSPSQMLLDALRTVADGGVYVDPGIAGVLVSAGSEGRLRYRDLLTPRELDVVDQITRGLTTQEAADQLGVSPKTVEAHRASVYRKMGVRNVAELTRLVAEASAPSPLPSPGLDENP